MIISLDRLGACCARDVPETCPLRAQAEETTQDVVARIGPWTHGPRRFLYCILVRLAVSLSRTPGRRNIDIRRFTVT